MLTTFRFLCRVESRLRKSAKKSDSMRRWQVPTENKSVGLCLGAWKGVPLPGYFLWTYGPVSILGIWFGPDLLLEMNCSEIQEKAEVAVQLWCPRGGGVCASHIYPIFLHRLSAFPLLSNTVISLVTLLSSFLRGGKSAKVPWKICYLYSSEGGLGMPSVKSRHHTLRITLVVESVANQMRRENSGWKKVVRIFHPEKCARILWAVLSLVDPTYVCATRWAGESEWVSMGAFRTVSLHSTLSAFPFALHFRFGTFPSQVKDESGPTLNFSIWYYHLIQGFRLCLKRFGSCVKSTKKSEGMRRWQVPRSTVISLLACSSLREREFLYQSLSSGRTGRWRYSVSILARSLAENQLVRDAGESRSCSSTVVPEESFLKWQG